MALEPEAPATPRVLPIMRYFAYEHLPAKLQEVSWPFGELAAHLAGLLHGRH